MHVPVKVLLACIPTQFPHTNSEQKILLSTGRNANHTWVWLCNSDDKKTPAAVLPTAAGDDMTAVAIAAGIRAAALAGASRHVPATAVPIILITANLPISLIIYLGYSMYNQKFC